MSLEPTTRSGRTLLLVCVILGGLFATLAIAGIVIHFWMLNTDQFNWLEGPKEKPSTK